MILSLYYVLNYKVLKDQEQIIKFLFHPCNKSQCNLIYNYLVAFIYYKKFCHLYSITIIKMLKVERYKIYIERFLYRLVFRTYFAEIFGSTF